MGGEHAIDIGEFQRFIEEMNRIRDKVDNLSGPGVRNTPTSISIDGAGDSGDVFAQVGEFVPVVIIDLETGGGYYKGSILYGVSNGGAGDLTKSNPPGTFNFQLNNPLVSNPQTKVDGLKPTLNSNGTPVNNALVINLAEPYVGSSHLLAPAVANNLWSTGVSSPIMFGKIIGATKETKPRMIVAVNQAPFFPVIVKITAPDPGNQGLYAGRTMVTNAVTGSPQGPLNNFVTNRYPTQANCWIWNMWEYAYGTSGTNLLPNGTFAMGIVAGVTDRSAVLDGNTNAADPWYQVYVWLQPQAATLAHPIQNIFTSQTPNSTYGVNEQSMLTAIKGDLNNLHASLNDFYTNQKTIGTQL